MFSWDELEGLNKNVFYRAPATHKYAFVYVKEEDGYIIIRKENGTGLTQFRKEYRSPAPRIFKGAETVLNDLREHGVTSCQVQL